MSDETVDRQRMRSSFANLVTDNPMMDEAKRETRRMLRTSATFGRGGLVITIGIIALIYLWLIVQTFITHEDGTPFYIYIELVLVTLAMPGSIYGAVSGEREKSTWDALILTRLTPGQIVAGKLIWRMRILAAIAVLMIVPVIVCRLGAHAFQTDGNAVIISQLLIGLWGVLLSCFGLWVSCITKRSIATLTIISVTLFGLLLGLPALYQMSMGMAHNYWALRHDPFNNLMISINPFTVLSDVLGSFHQTDGNIEVLRDRSGGMACTVFALLIPVFITASYRRLTKLGEPGIS